MWISIISINTWIRIIKKTRIIKIRIIKTWGTTKIIRVKIIIGIIKIVTIIIIITITIRRITRKKTKKKTCIELSS